MRQAGVVGNAQLPVQLHGGDALFGLGQKVNGLKPDGQRQFARFKDRAGDERDLAMAAVALTQFAGVEVAAFVVSAVGADKAVWPALFEQ